MRNRAASMAAVTSIAAAMFGAASAHAGQDPSALSKATLDYTVSVNCTLTTPSASSNVPCSSTLWNISLSPGWSATMTATWNWHYTDDGLPVERGALFDPRSFGGTRHVDFESGGIYVQSLPFCGRPGCTPLAANVSGDTGMLAVFESDNNVPDDITGSRTLTVTANFPSTFGGGESAQFGFFQIGTWVNSASAVAPIPEPSTWALFGVSLAALALVRQRRMSKD